jgi:putative hydroxymethylpyrimidine transport system ATP-binding protein
MSGEGDANVFVADNICFGFPGKRSVLDQVTFALKERHFHVLVGPSGAGKSTLLKLCAGLLNAKEGTFLLNGSVADCSQRLMQSVYMPQSDTLLPWRTVLDNVMLTLELQGKQSAEEMQERAMALLDSFGLRDCADAYPDQLSGGMKQRVMFARTMLKNVPLLLLDEPFSALDSLTRKQMQRWLLDVWQRDRRTVLMVTHDIDEALLLADTVLVLPSEPGETVQALEVTFARPRSFELIYEPAFVERKRLLENMLLGGDNL